MEKKKGTNRPGENLESEELSSLEDLSEPSLEAESAEGVRGGATSRQRFQGVEGESQATDHAGEIEI